MKVTLGELLTGELASEFAVSCGARTRAGTPCNRLPPVNRSRCNLHGGKSLAGIAHPNYKHGLYSKHNFAYGSAAALQAEWLAERARRKQQRIDRVIARRFDEWYEVFMYEFMYEGGKVCADVFLGTYQRIRREHLASLEERRARYAERKRLSNRFTQ